MVQKMSELKARFELARQNLATVLEQSDGEAVHHVAAADRELSKIFQQILDARLTSNEERVARIEFLLNEIVGASEQDGLVCTLAEKALGDVLAAFGTHREMNDAVSEAS